MSINLKKEINKLDLGKRGIEQNVLQSSKDVYLAKGGHGQLQRRNVVSLFAK